MSTVRQQHGLVAWMVAAAAMIGSANCQLPQPAGPSQLAGALAVGPLALCAGAGGEAHFRGARLAGALRPHLLLRNKP